MVDFQQHLGEFEKRGVLVVAASVETLADAQNTVAGQGVHFPMGYGLDAEEFAGRFGAYYEPEGKYLHATGFLLRPNGSVEIAAYSSGSIGRLTAADSLKALDHYLAQEN